ncbi:Protein kinase domain and Serine-threonine/tyrosine-protein kinase catalytic domain and Immunoglobulin subtype 2 domain and Immunoglobulin subtype domain and Immunoglobulin-like domain and Protein kinase-like domain and Immunoglobulin I-set domain and Immunoglobulin-like fold domain and Tyrosine-protein kinase, catalytic domain-containing protein [Strongyloides ratti]|uniref:receptor protein-tyrosine kinase n=1 Tax=Strongyloides ratti TaxID=34506 RepID=A0A090LT51_STRRB|nr:Protein kinase domain and Serine-threonine/tyrosine-protein kinase catalytic domain and Immunoglobulin subtype 2 domain and Immunoglobulin subtype domain and Immunoglobulin-like domain and Protein kinase-like domain and Immunoglobulin I-set domain and Immunoglobulin-like fold domain and Tyrosine-protein kinase, catalytic domain-containing protein [Strongyloides ratti]CEF70769.1 Protein kinase domain and Serine-threonine/tyrosine-protein kinase catalytic domain and Immunoglobulin subtype 2 domai
MFKNTIFGKYTIFLIFLLQNTSFEIRFENSLFAEGPPRFEKIAKVTHDVLLGESVKLDCSALARPAPSIHWYRNDIFLTYNMLKSDERLQEKKMTLEINGIEVKDQGKWACKAWNSQGYIFRNFTIEVIDYCDYYKKEGINPSIVPLECICLWLTLHERITDEDVWGDMNKTDCIAHKDFIKRNIQNLNTGIENKEEEEEETKVTLGYVTKTYESYSNKLLPAIYTTTSLPKKESKHDDSDSNHFTHDVILPSSNNNGKQPDIQETGGDDDDDSDESLFDPSLLDKNYLTQPIKSLSKYRGYNEGERTKPYFKGKNDSENMKEHIVVPAGKTINLPCKAYGVPEPDTVWFRNYKLIMGGTTRPTGSIYKKRKWSLQIEDISDADSGTFICEAFNSQGSAKKVYIVEVVDRLRTKPIMVPGVLQSLSIDTNKTANFTCRYISDLTPHIMWVKLKKNTDHDFVVFNHSSPKYKFNYTDVMENPRATIIDGIDTTTLLINNVTINDKGVYACLIGNSLGFTMDMANLTVNEFHTYIIKTLDPSNVNISPYIIYTSIGIIILIGILIASGIYCWLIRKKNADQFKVFNPDDVNVGVKKIVSVVPKKVTNGDPNWSDFTSSYEISIRQVLSKHHCVNNDVPGLANYEAETDPKWEIDRNRLQMLSILGEGAFGQVWKGLLTQKVSKVGKTETIPVAVKKLKRDAQEKEFVDLISEMQTFKSIGHHENILSLLGCCTGRGPLLMVLQLCKYGNLRDFLRSHRPNEVREANDRRNQGIADELDIFDTSTVNYLKPLDGSNSEPVQSLTQRHLVQFALQIASGMEHLAKRKIIHRDLAARNVLVADNYILKISDFGLSRDINLNNYYRKKENGRLPIKWMALEALDSLVYTLASDVWSFGILLWEIMTLGGTPYPTIDMAKLFTILKKGYRMEAPHNCPQEIYNVMQACWQEKAEDRPTFTAIIDYFQWMIKNDDALQRGEIIEYESSDDEDRNENNSLIPKHDNKNFLKKTKLMRGLDEVVVIEPEELRRNRMTYAISARANEIFRSPGMSEKPLNIELVEENSTWYDNGQNLSPGGRKRIRRDSSSLHYIQTETTPPPLPPRLGRSESIKHKSSFEHHHTILPLPQINEESENLKSSKTSTSDSSAESNETAKFVGTSQYYNTNMRDEDKKQQQSMDLSTTHQSISRKNSNKKTNSLNELTLTSTNLFDLKKWKFEETKYVHSSESSSGRGSSNGMSNYLEEIDDSDDNNKIQRIRKIYTNDYYTSINYNTKLKKKHEYLNI